MVKRNTTNIPQKEYDDGRLEYGYILNKYVIPKGNDMKIGEVWNVYTNQKVPDPVFLV